MGWIKSGEGRKLKRAVGRLTKVLVSESQRERQSLASLPSVLEEITLTKQIRVIDRIADIDVGGAAGAAEIVDKVSQRRKPATIGKTKRTTFVEWRVLARHLFQELTTKTEGVGAVNLRDRVLNQIIVGDAKLRNVGGDADGREIGHADVWHRKRQRRIRSRDGKIKIDNPIGRDAQLVGDRRVDRPGMGYQEVTRESDEVSRKKGRVHRAGGIDVVIVNITKGKLVLIANLMVNPQYPLPIIRQRRGGYLNQSCLHRAAIGKADSSAV